MSALLTPDLAQIERELDRFLKLDPEATILGMHAPTSRNWPPFVERGGRQFRLAWCPSELELLERIEGNEAEGGDGIVVLTPLDTASLGDDVKARLPKGRLARSDRWAVLPDLFRARSVESRLRTQRELADLLIAFSPVGGYPAAPGGMLDLETAWRALQEQVLGLEAGRTDAVALLEWSLDLGKVARFATLSDEPRRMVAQRLTAAGGPAAEIVLGAAASGPDADALPIGLVCGVIFGEAELTPDLREAAVRLEPLVGGVRVTPEAGKVLAEAARRVLGTLVAEEPARAQSVQMRAVSLIAIVRAEAAVAASAALDLGLDARMKNTAAAVTAAVKSGLGDDAAHAWKLAQLAEQHDRARQRKVRIDRLIMAARLACWLTARRSNPPRDMAEAAASYAAHGGFADRARHALQHGDEIPEVAAAYAGLRAAATYRRETENREFAALFSDWNGGGSWGNDPLPVERLLDRIVVPLARDRPVLLLVLDGLSFAAWRALAETLPRLGWNELRPKGRTAPSAAVAAVPSVTNVSRVSLLCGALSRGGQATEQAGFAAHPGLLAARRSGPAPKLFHKADLGPGPELAEIVGLAIADTAQRVVGVVHNAVDAQLAGSDQLEINWSAEGLRPIPALLRVARDAGRVIVVTGDHGHVIEDGTSQRADGVNHRWRAAGVAGEGEIALSGGRVLTPDGGEAVVVPWSEGVRYASKANGYHGGVSPQEILIPVAVLGSGDDPADWELSPPTEPDWWRGICGVSLDAVPPMSEDSTAAAVVGRKKIDQRQPELFAQMPRAENRESVPVPTWLASLLESSAYAAQRRMAGRGAPSDEQLRTLLQALSARGGRVSRTSLAQALSAPSIRIVGIVNAARRVLNLDQAQVLSMDGDDVVLDERLLRVQFGLGNNE